MVETPYIGDARLFVALTEEHVSYTGPNNERDHYDVFRWINNNNVHGGVTINLTTAGAQTYTETMSLVPVNNVPPLPNRDQLHAVVWVQNIATLELLQAAETDLQEALAVPPSGAPLLARLDQNRPNPFTPSTIIEYSLARPGAIQLNIYDAQGRKVRALDGGLREPAAYRVPWDGRDDAGNELGSGIYFYELTAPDVHETRRMVLLR